MKMISKVFLTNTIIIVCWFAFLPANQLFAQWQQLHRVIDYQLALSHFTPLGNFVFATADNGPRGIFRSSNTGVSWVESDSGLHSAQISSLSTFDGTLYADSAGKIYSSTDTGKHWSRADTSVIWPCFDNGNYLFAIHGGTVIRSSDQGSTWGITSTGLPTKVDLIWIKQSTLFVVGTGNIYRSTNNGALWTHSSAAPTGMYKVLAEGSYLFAASDKHGVFRSSDTGVSWTQTNSGLSDTAINALCTNGTYLLAGTSSGIFQSSNAGNSWTRVDTVSVSSNSLILLSSNALAGSSAGIFTSSNNGSTWSYSGIVQHDTGGVSVYYILFKWGGGKSEFDMPSGNFVLCNGQIFAVSYDGIIRSSDQGSTWSRVSSPPGWNAYSQNSFDGHLSVAHGKLFAQTLDTGEATPKEVRRSSDNGLSWSVITLDTLTPNPYDSRYPFIIDFTEYGNKIIAAAGGVNPQHYTGIYRSLDSGLTWYASSSGLVISDAQHSGTAACFIGKAASRLFTDCEVEGGIFGAGGSTTWGVHGGLRSSTDSGLTWSSYGALTGLFQASITKGPNSLVSIMGDGNYISTDDGSTWIKLTSGLPEPVTAFTNAGTKLFAICSKGIYGSPDSGWTWRNAGSGLYESPATVAFDGTYLYAGSSSIWRRALSDIPLQIAESGVQSHQTKNSFTLFPNPTSSSVRIQYSNDADVAVSITLFDPLGRTVATPITSEFESPGEHTLPFDCHMLAPGVYTARLVAGDWVEMAKFVVAR